MLFESSNEAVQVPSASTAASATTGPVDPIRSFADPFGTKSRPVTVTVAPGRCAADVPSGPAAGRSRVMNAWGVHAQAVAIAMEANTPASTSTYNHLTFTIRNLPRGEGPGKGAGGLHWRSRQLCGEHTYCA